MSSDIYRFDERLSQRPATAGPRRRSSPVGICCIAKPEASARGVTGQLPRDEGWRDVPGGEAEALASRAARRPWTESGECPREELRAPDRVHVDRLGFVYICQPISVGNVLEEGLREFCERHDPSHHPVTGPLLDGGPAELARRYDLSPGTAETLAEACRLCDRTRRALRPRLPEVLTSGQMYGVPEAPQRRSRAVSPSTAS